MDMSTLPKAVDLALAGGRAPRWSPGLSRRGQQVLHSEFFAPADEASAAACALSLLLDDMRGADCARLEQKFVLWVQDAAAVRLAGRPFRAGLPPALRHRLIHVLAKRPQDALFALEEGLHCRDLAAVVGEIVGNPKALDFTASRRLSLTAEKHGVPLYLVRLDAVPDLSSARMRWQVRSAVSNQPRWNRAAPGHPAWRVELFRARGHAPGEWVLRDDGQSLAAEGGAHALRDTGSATAPDIVDLVHAAGA